MKKNLWLQLTPKDNKPEFDVAIGTDDTIIEMPEENEPEHTLGGEQT